MTDAPLILFSGMGADERVFRPQLDAFANIVVPRWIEAHASDTLADYATRLARQVDPGRPCFVGGASFGGMVAMEVARRLAHVLGCFLIGSVRSPKELPLRVRALRCTARLAPFVPFGSFLQTAKTFVHFSGRFCSPANCSLLQQVSDADPRFLRWACRAVLTWAQHNDEPNFPIHQIHGDRDRILPWRLTKPDVLVRGAGHVLSLTHPREVNDFIRSRLCAGVAT